MAVHLSWLDQNSRYYALLSFTGDLDDADCDNLREGDIHNELIQIGGPFVLVVDMTEGRPARLGVLSHVIRLLPAIPAEIQAIAFVGVSVFLKVLLSSAFSANNMDTLPQIIFSESIAAARIELQGFLPLQDD